MESQKQNQGNNKERKWKELEEKLKKLYQDNADINIPKKEDEKRVDQAAQNFINTYKYLFVDQGEKLNKFGVNLIEALEMSDPSEKAQKIEDFITEKKNRSDELKNNYQTKSDNLIAGLGRTEYATSVAFIACLMLIAKIRYKNNPDNKKLFEQNFKEFKDFFKKVDKTTFNSIAIFQQYQQKQERKQEYNFRRD
ncbi:hypothetical protein [Cysteiniphilum sp. JM-1]|uniref:hypothetical protein n=1 Tax=Cysteiniphilum sp. JM-1 TaxID=2610891 RepID=UPI0012484F98|nr:hypothetical protein [Cysteiniphilum sp. JM-1]